MTQKGSRGDVTIRMSREAFDEFVNNGQIGEEFQKAVDHTESCLNNYFEKRSPVQGFFSKLRAALANEFTQSARSEVKSEEFKASVTFSVQDL